MTDNVAPVASNVGGTTLLSFGSLIGPPSANPPGGIQPPGPDCRIALDSVSSGFNVVTDGSCDLDAPSDIQEVDVPLLAPLDENGGFGETRMPLAGSLLLDQIPVRPVRVRAVRGGARGGATPRRVRPRCVRCGHLGSTGHVSPRGPSL